MKWIYEKGRKFFDGSISSFSKTLCDRQVLKSYWYSAHTIKDSLRQKCKKFVT